MNLLDHFHPPLAPERRWESFHAHWASTISAYLNIWLPERYFSEMQVHFGARIEVDVAALEREQPRPPEPKGDGGGVATLEAPAWTLTEPAMAMPAVFPDHVEVQVYNGEGGPTLVAAVELVSPGNKDRPEHRRAFAAKCAALLQKRVGTAVVDVVTGRRQNLHNELVDLLGLDDRYRIAPDPLYAVSYGPARRAGGDVVDVWPAALALGGPLPVVPLPLDRGLVVPVDLGGTYSETCRRTRLARPPAGTTPPRSADQ